MNVPTGVMRLFLVLTAVLIGADQAASADPLAECRDAYAAYDLAASRAAAAAALVQDPDSYAGHWMLARVLIDLGNKTDDKDDRLALYEDAEGHARRAVALNPDDTWGHHYLAASVGKLALFHGGKTKIELSREVRDEAQRAIELDPGNDKSLHIMGRWNRGVATLSPIKKLAAKIVYGGVPEGASLENAVMYFQQAIEINPGHINHHLELGNTYLEMGRYDEAIASFETAFSLPESDPNDPEYLEEAEKQLKKAQRKASGARGDKSR